MNVTLTFTIDEVNYILAALGTRPFAEVNGLIQKIKSEGDSQIAAVVPAPAPAPEESATPDAPTE
jgi:hypothetical protein